MRQDIIVLTYNHLRLVVEGPISQNEWRFFPNGAQWRNGAVESLVKQFKRSLEIYKQTGLTYAELQSLFKKTSALMNSRPLSARYGTRQVITLNMMLTERTGVDLPVMEYSDEYKPSKRLAYKDELERKLLVTVKSTVL